MTSYGLTYGAPQSDSDFEEILALQADNLERTLGPDGLEQGFVTVQHDLQVLRDMNQAGQHAIARVANQVVGYALCMPVSFASRVPILEPMFKMFDSVTFEDKGKLTPVSQLRYFVMGQVCIARDWRGRGVFDGLYRQLRALHTGSFDAVITEVAGRNVRSIRAHQRVGFETIKQYEAPLNPAKPDGNLENWEIMMWDWRA